MARIVFFKLIVLILSICYHKVMRCRAFIPWLKPWAFPHGIRKNGESERYNMSHIDISTDGTRYKQLVSLHEEQIRNLKQSEEPERQAYEAYEKALWDSITNTSADVDEQAELLRNRKTVEQEYRAAVKNGRDASKRAVATAVELVAELLHDNIDVLDGKCLNDKTVSRALNEALPDDIYVFTNESTEDTVLYVEGGEISFRMRHYLRSCNKATHIHPCRTDSDIISKQRFMNDYNQGIYKR